MLKADDVKIKLVPKNKLRFTFLIVVVAISGIIYGVWLRQHSSQTLRVDDQSYRLTVVTTETAQEKGLGGRVSMPVNQGMLFAFSNEAIHCFWMKNMNFSLDMIWLNANKQVVYIQPNVATNTYPEAFCPTQLAKYVIELNAGQAAASNIHTGQTLTF